MLPGTKPGARPRGRSLSQGEPTTLDRRRAGSAGVPPAALESRAGGPQNPAQAFPVGVELEEWRDAASNPAPFGRPDSSGRLTSSLAAEARHSDFLESAGGREVIDPVPTRAGLGHRCRVESAIVECGHKRSEGASTRLSSRPGEFHPRALPEPCVKLSLHTAPDVRPLAQTSNGLASSRGSSCCQLASGLS